MKPISHAKRITQEAEVSKKEICRLLGWTELQYCEFQFETGLLYLSFYLHNDDWGIDLIKKCSAFWSWWTNHWAIRDAEFLAYAEEEKLSRKLYEVAYMTHHDGQKLASAIYPSGIVLQDTYAYMMGVLIDENE